MASSPTVAALRATHDQRQAEACRTLFSHLPSVSAILRANNTDSIRQATDEQLEFLLKYARLGHSATCLAVIDRIDLENE